MARDHKKSTQKWFLLLSIKLYSFIQELIKVKSRNFNQILKIFPVDLQRSGFCIKLTYNHREHDFVAEASRHLNVTDTSVLNDY